MGNKNSSSTADITEVFNETFWKDHAMETVKAAVTVNVNETFHIGELSVS